MRSLPLIASAADPGGGPDAVRTDAVRTGQAGRAATGQAGRAATSQAGRAATSQAGRAATGPAGGVVPGPAGAGLRRGVPVPRHLADLDLAGRRAAVAGLGEQAYRAGQLSAHYFGRLVRDPAAMTDLPAGLRDRLVAELLPELLTPVRELACDGGATRKTLWRLHDGALVEGVLMGYADRVTACVSSQAGCGMACPFCATGQAGLTRNLSTAEIVDQVVSLAAIAAGGLSGVDSLPGGRSADGLTADRPAGDALKSGGLSGDGLSGGHPVGEGPGSGGLSDGGGRGEGKQSTDGPPARLSRVVFMGMGEPLANYPRVIEAVRRLTAPAPDGLGLSQRHITVSTVGLVPAMRRLAGEGLSVTLALSLHAPDDDLRDELVPVNRRWKVAEVLDAAEDYAASTGRRFSIEYAMIRDVNDQPWRADLLGRLLGGRLAHVNLIPLNPTPGSRWDASPKPVEREFVRRLRMAGIPTTVRDTRGREIDGACGQLAAGGHTGETGGHSGISGGGEVVG